MELNKMTEKIIGCAIEVHKLPGPGLLESAYEECLMYELAKTGQNITTFGEYIRKLRVSAELPHRKLSAQLDIDPSLLGTIE